MKKKKEPQIAGRPGKQIEGSPVPAPDEKGLWFLVLRHLERNHVSYFPLNHHLVAQGRLPDKVPSMGGVRYGNGTSGDNMIPTDKNGYINLADADAGEIVGLMRTGTVRPLQVTKRLRKILEEGSQMSSTRTVDLIPGMKKIITVSDQYAQITGEHLPREGGNNDVFFEAVKNKFPGGVPLVPAGR